MKHHTLENTRLEIEVPTSGLPNLVQNPSGDLGAWFYVTPTNNTLMKIDYGGLTFYDNAGTAANFTTDFMPVVATKYVASRVDLIVISNTHNFKIRYEWYDGSKALLSSSIQSSALSTVGVLYGPVVQAPASTVYVKMRVDFYKGAGGTPDPGSLMAFKNAMVTWTNTATVTSQRINLIPNPNYESNLTGWSSSRGGQTLARTNAQAQVGTWSMSVTEDPGGVTGNYLGIQTPEGTSGFAVTGGVTYTAAVYVRAGATSRKARVKLRWYTAAGALISSNSTDTALTNATWVRASATGTAPTNAAYGTAILEYFRETGSIPDSETCYVDAWMVETGLSAGTYFDGATTDTGSITYDWLGTTNQSASTATTASGVFDFAEPNDWQNIFAESTTIDVQRQVLNVGTSSITIADPLLDPSVSAVIRKGKKVRLRTLIAGTWESVYEGRINQAVVEYVSDPQSPGHVEGLVELTTTDNIAALSNQAEPRGVEGIDALPVILEGASTPWNCNGSRDQVAAFTQVSSNDNASVLDQIAVTRDTALGQAWVDRNNVLNAFDANQLSTAIKAAFFDTAHDTRDLTNTVTNPTALNDATGWTSLVGAETTIARSTAWRTSGAIRATKAVDSTGPLGVIAGGTSVNGSRAVVPGQVVKMTVTVHNPNASAKDVFLGHYYYTNALGFVSQLFSTPVALAAGATQTLQYTTTVPATADLNLATVIAYDTGTVNMTNTHTLDVDECIVTIHSVDGDYPTYFDGSTNGATAWVGTADASYSTYDADLAAYYRDPDADFNIESVVNVVRVDWLRYNSAAGATETVTYGPYMDADSINTWGASSATFTIHGLTEDAGDIADFAAAVLAANATPMRRIHSLVMPVRDAQSFKLATQLDLCDLVEVTLTDVVTAESYRITAIDHAISPTGWLVTYTFDNPDGVATPTVIPNPASTATSDGTWIAPTLTNSWVNFGSVFANAGYLREGGWVHLRGLVKNGTVNTAIMTLPAGYRPSATLVFAAVNNSVDTGAQTAGTAHTHPVTNYAARIQVASDGTVTLVAGGNGFVSLSNIMFRAEA